MEKPDQRKKPTDNNKCARCLRVYQVENAIILKACKHSMCKECVIDYFFKNTKLNMKCEFNINTDVKCNKIISEKEMRSVLKEVGLEPVEMDEPLKTQKSCKIEQLTMLDELSYVKNNEEFDCPICFVPCNAQEGITLRNCFHQFCLECFTNTVCHSEDEAIKCPYNDENLFSCENFIEEREIRGVVSTEIYNKFLERKLKFAEHNIANTFHCKTINSSGFGIIEEEDVQMICVVCKQQNCLQCKAIHTNQSCKEYQDSLADSSQATEVYIDQQKKLGIVMQCPNYKTLIDKIDGCSWVRCTCCKTEICWATKGPRWGPKGYGDIGGGCRCNVNGMYCHPTCRDCH